MIRLLAVAALSLAGCDLVLGIPNPDEIKDIETVGARLCECPNLAQQGADVVAACQAGVNASGEEGLKVLAEADCTDCGNSSECYALATGAGEIGSSCTSHAECNSFACCATNISTSFLEVGVVVSGACCEACAACSGVFASGVEWLPPLCVETVDGLVTPTGDLNPDHEIFVLSVCLCQPEAMSQCHADGLCPDPLDVANDCSAFIADVVCRDCLFGAVPENSCNEQINACNAGVNRPVR